MKKQKIWALILAVGLIGMSNITDAKQARIAPSDPPAEWVCPCLCFVEGDPLGGGLKNIPASSTEETDAASCDAAFVGDRCFVEGGTGTISGCNEPGWI